MFPTIANLLNITVDELMGNDTYKKVPRKKSIITYVSIVISLIVISLLFILIKPFKLIEKRIIINETENNLNIKLPVVESYNIVDYNDWLSFNNYMYPNQIYYLVFKEELIEIDDTWLEQLPQEMINSIPIGSSEYPYICDYYKLIDLTANKVNEISSSEKGHEYILYCLQINTKRLIAIKFEV